MSPTPQQTESSLMANFLTDEQKIKRDKHEQAMKQMMSNFRTATEIEIDSLNDAKSELLEGIREIYALRGEDKVISDICNKLLDRHGRSL